MTDSPQPPTMRLLEPAAKHTLLLRARFAEARLDQ
jgi:hypothetical protein